MFWSSADERGDTIETLKCILSFKPGQNNSEIKVINPLFFSIFCPLVTVNFAEWHKKRETGKFAKSLSEIMVTQKSFEQKRGQ